MCKLFHELVFSFSVGFFYNCRAPCVNVCIQIIGLLDIELFNGVGVWPSTLHSKSLVCWIKMTCSTSVHPVASYRPYSSQLYWLVDWQLAHPFRLFPEHPQWCFCDIVVLCSYPYCILECCRRQWWWARSATIMKRPTYMRWQTCHCGVTWPPLPECGQNKSGDRGPTLPWRLTGLQWRGRGNACIT